MLKKVSGKYVLIILVIIISAGFVIWSYNFFQGKNLANPPKFDLSAYDNLQNWPTPEEAFGETTSAKIKSEIANLFTSKVEESLSTKNIDDSKFKYSGLYLHSELMGNTGEKIDQQIQSWKSSFLWLKDFEIVNLLKNKCVNVVINSKQGQDNLQRLIKDEAIQFTTIENNSQICFPVEQYFDQVAILMSYYPGIELIPLDSNDCRANG